MVSLCFEVNNKCNLRCIHCFQDANDKKSDELSKDKFEECVSYSMLCGNKKIYLSGGEVFLHPDWFEMVETAQHYRQDVILITNGTLINDGVIKKLQQLDHSKLELILSIDGPDQEKNDYIRGKGAFSKTLTALDALKNSSLNSKINIQIVLTKISNKSIEQILSFAEKYNPSSVYFLFPQKWGRAIANWNKIMLNQKEALRAAYQIKAIREDKTYGFEIRSAYDGFFSLNEQSDISSCSFSDELYIDSTGDVYGCDGSYNCPDLKFGNIYKDPLFRILQSERVVRLINICRDRKNKLDKCQTCGLLKKCAGGCMVNAYLTTGSLLGEDLYCDLKLKISKS